MEELGEEISQGTKKKKRNILEVNRKEKEKKNITWRDSKFFKAL